MSELFFQENAFNESFMTLLREISGIHPELTEELSISCVGVLLVTNLFKVS